jgi:dTMP kinase
MKLQPFSSCRRGIFVSVDGPSGAGKSTVVQHLAQMLVAAGEDVHVTAEPSTGPIGAIAHELTETVLGHALACLYAADRYIPSGLVMQRFDGVDPVFLWQINEEAERPDLTVILDADPNVIAERLSERGPHNRFQLTSGSSHAEVHFYRQATDRLIEAGFEVLRVDSSYRAPEATAAVIHQRLTAFFASSIEE